MKFQIKTLDRRTFNVNFSEFKTVGDLKEHVCRLRGAWVHPEAQQLIYAGQVLDDHERLRTYCIDERKFLLMLTKQKKLEQPPTEIKKNSVDQQPAIAKRVIMSLGPWTEKDVRRALQINLNIPSRAINYLKKEKELFPKMVTPPASNLHLSISREQFENRQTECENSKKPWKIFDPDMLLKPIQSKKHIQNLNYLMNMGFPSDTAFEAYTTCDGDTQAAANLLLNISES